MRRFISAAAQLSDIIVTVLLFLMMAVTFFDVCGRYFLHRPIQGSTEMLQYMLVIVIFVALPVVTAREQHIMISLVEGLFGPTINHFHRALVRLLAGAIMLVVCGCMWQYAGLLVQNRDVIGYLLLPLAPAAYAVCLLSAMTGIAFLATAAGEVRQWRSR